MLEVSGLTVRFGGLTALDGLQLRAAAGELLGLIGPNGSGKTTFFNALTGFVPVSGGQVRFDGKDITGAAPRRVAACGIARTFQRLRLLSELSVFDNLMLGLHLDLPHGPWVNLFARRRLAAAVRERAAEARELLAVFSPALAGRLAEPLRALPMIDRRRVEICRALVRAPRLLLLDEPSAGMTPDETAALMDDLHAVKARRPGTAVILIEHDMAVIERVSDRCLVLDYGRRLCEGSFAAVSRDPEVRRAYLGEA
ncbi:MAG: ABC transporter ATP-binding protein [Rhodocyclaceae bacterium]|jgi:branched-chain amino acid transport system ATP-binding protein|nr:ABC transporter ATP-binding protein [Rhodocyclaceae bacterium]MCA3133874.1 ABC transporter ATP-binding protein [Rhodocyclaceae bacterium]MCA3143348.1 ABC transporter ATP-binding protein [Rhodocyclaceae bacterium]MCA3147230.1 ABC transporter ATP-binding protein [Rhodocyclaceae bacterium]